LSSFLAAHPHVSVDLEERLSDEIVGLIAEGVGDLGIVAGTVDASALATYPFRRDRFVLVVARDHPLARRAKISFAQVLDYDFVGLDRASALQRFLADKAARIGRPLRLRVQLRSFDAVCRLVECNVGIGIVPETTARRVARSKPAAPSNPPIQTHHGAPASREPDGIGRQIATERTRSAIVPTTNEICVRDFGELAPYARQLVEHLRSGGTA